MNLTSADDIRVSTAVLADLFGVSVVVIGKLINEHHVMERQKPADGYDLRTACRAVLGHYRRIASGRGEGGEARVLASARARQAIAAAEERELRNEIMRGERVSIKAVEKAWMGLFATCREIVLSSIAQLADALSYHTTQDREQAYQIVEDKLYEMLNELAGGDHLPEKIAEAQRAKRRINHDQNRYSESSDGEGNFAIDAAARSRRGDDVVVPGPRNSSTAPFRRDQTRNAITLCTR
jgi:phage terminase Nu1 subunit (DNA packaging protein)